MRDHNNNNKEKSTGNYVVHKPLKMEAKDHKDTHTHVANEISKLAKMK